MRITTGIYKGRNLVMPSGIRPTQNMVRKAIFDILGDIEGLSFLELFAGSGAVGFEALSRGAKSLRLVENNRDSLASIKKNMEILKIQSCQVLQQDAIRAVEYFAKNNEKFDIVFLDPPYYVNRQAIQDSLKEDLTLAKKTLQSLNACDILSPDGLVVVQHFQKDSLPDDLGVLSLLKKSSYGSTILSIYHKAS